MDTGEGDICTVTSRAWKVTHQTNHSTALSGFQDERPPKICPIVNAVTKATFPGRPDPVLLGVNYVTLVTDTNESESLVVSFCMMAHGIETNLVPEKFKIIYYYI